MAAARDRVDRLLDAKRPLRSLKSRYREAIERYTLEFFRVTKRPGVPDFEIEPWDRVEAAVGADWLITGEGRSDLRRLYAEWPFFRALVENLEMTLAKSSFEIAEAYVSLVPEQAQPERFWSSLSAEHARTVDSVLAIVEARELLDRHPVVQRSIRLRNPYVDPMNAIQVELLRAWRGGDEAARAPPCRPRSAA